MNTEKIKFGILGYGYVGRATHLGLLGDQKCAIHDIKFVTSLEVFQNVETVFVCIPTETDRDIEIIVEEIKKIKSINRHCLFIIRSTLPLGACDKIQTAAGPIIYMPEFLRERFWDTDCFKRPLIVGHDKETTLPGWLTEEKIYECSTSEAELVKMFSNNFAVVRIAFANVFYDLSQSVNADYDKVKDMFFKIQQDQTYMEVPGHDGTRGFGGKCLPKDLDFLIDTLKQMNIDQNWFEHIRKLNARWQDKFEK